MIAIFNWPTAGDVRRSFALTTLLTKWSWVWSIALLFPASATSAESGLSEPHSTTIFAARAEKAFQAARTRFNSEPTNSEAAWQFGRTCFDVAEFAEDSKQREDFATQGIQACRQLVVRQPKMVAGHYYLAMNLGQLARTKTLGALKLVGEMETEFQRAHDLDENFDYAGPDRNLGLLYLEAPGWPTSIGNRSKARHHLQRAVLLHPNFPENRLNLLECYIKLGDKTGAQLQFKELKELWPAAKKLFSGEPLESSWVDWEKRWQKIQSKLSEPSKIIESPGSKK
ncbi:MAG: hypothetical protein ABIP71_13985 [Verrucomicrobiota bacterium]